MKNKLTLLATLLLAGMFTQAQYPFLLINPEDPGDNYGNGTENMIGQRHYFWDVNTATWTNSDTFNMQYNNQNLCVLRKWLTPDTSINGPWNYVKVVVQDYNANGQLIAREDTFPNDNGTDFRYEFTLNGNGKEILAHEYGRAAGQSALANRYRRQTSYTGTDDVLVQLVEGWNLGTSAWINYQRQVHTYNSQNLDSILAYENWNTGTNAWGGNYNHYFTYDANGNNTNILRKRWISYLSAFRNETQTDYTYDASNRVLSYSPAAWDTASNGWIYTYRTNYGYNTQGLLENELVEKYNTNNGQWEFWTLSTYSYDANNRLTELLQQNWSGSIWVNAWKQIYTRNTNGYRTQYLNQNWNTNTLAWRNNGRTDYWYSAKQTSGISDQEQDQLTVYPNPSNSPVTFVNADKNLPYAVYDMQRRMVQHGNLQPGTNSIILNEAKGNYILKAGNSSTILVKQ